MSQRETELHHITSLLGQCLGRIDEQAFRLQRMDDDDDLDAPDVLEREAATLQELVASMLAAEQTVEHSDLATVTERAVRDCTAELGVPIVVRQRLENDLPPVACKPGQLAFAVQRAVMLCLGRLGAGDELSLTTRREQDHVLLELEAHGTRRDRDRHLQARGTTLMEFVAGLRGDCRLDVDDRGGLLVAIELPTVHALERD
jgi:hypothetical protein